MAGEQPQYKTLRVPIPRYLNRWRVLLLMSIQAAVCVCGVVLTSNLWDDGIAGYLDFRALLCWVWRPSALLLRLCFKFTRDVVKRYGLCRVSLYLAFVVITAVTLSALCHGSLPAYVWETMEKNNFIAKIKENIIKVDARRDFPYKIEHHFRTRGRFPPYLLETYHRYQGEDVHFSCQISFDVGVNDIVHRSMLFWLQETDSLQIVNPSARRFIKTTLTRARIPGQEIVNGTKVRLTFTSELRIYLIDEEDYGNYTCAIYGKFLVLEEVRASPEQTCRSESRRHSNQAEPEVPSSIGPSCGPDFQQLMDSMACTANRMKCFEKYVMGLKNETNIRRMLLNREEFTRSLSAFKMNFLEFLSSLHQTKRCGGHWFQYFANFMDEKIRHAENLRASTLQFFKSIHPSLWKLEEVLPDLEDIGSYRLVEVKPRTEEMRAPHGSLFALKTDFFHLNEADEITVSYTVNGRSVEHCDDIAGSCSKTVFLYWLFFHDGGYYWDVLKHYVFLFPSGCRGLVHSRLEDTSRVIMDFWKCLCYASFGKHEIVFHRFFFNALSRTTTVHEFIHPHTVYVAPTPNELFEPYQNSSTPHDNSPIENCWSTQNYNELQPPCSQQEKWMKSNIVSFSKWEMLLLNLGLILWIAMIVLLQVLLPICLAKHGSRLILGGEVFFRHRALPPTTPLGDLEWNPDLPPVYDVFLSHAEQQCDLVRDSLTPRLESWDLQVFLPSRDLELGTVEIMAIASALNQSRKVLVVVSPEYTADHYLNNFEFQIILSAVFKGFLRQQDVLLYRCGNCPIPGVLQSYPSINASDNSLTDLDLEAQLKAWAKNNPVALAPGGWRSWRPSFSCFSCGSLLMVAIYLANSHLQPVLAK